MSHKFKTISEGKMATSTMAAQTQAKLKEAIAHHQKGQLTQAQKAYEDILKAHPRNFYCLHLLGVVASQTGNHQLAVDLIGKAISVNPNDASAYSSRGLALNELKQHKAALESCNKAIALDPHLADAFNNRGIALRELNQYEAALESYDKAIAIQPRFADAYNNRSIALRDLCQYEAALDCCNMAITIKPDFADAYCNRGVALGELRRYEDAVDAYNSALFIKADYADAYSNRGNAQKELMQYDVALESYNKAIALDPNYAEAYNNRGNLQRELKRNEAALASFDQAIAIKPDLAEAHINRGDVLRELEQLDAAVVSYARGMAIKPNHGYTSGTSLFTKMRLCDWTDFEKDISELISKIEREEKSSSPFVLLPIITSLSLQRKATAVVVKNNYPANFSLGGMPERARSEKIHIGYYSADFHNHATAYLMAELFERHDRNKFELIAFSFGPKNKDQMRERVSAAFDQFIDVRMKSDREVAKLSRALGIDIAIDLKGFTQDSRLGIFSYRAAPIQVGYLGYPGTMAADYIDYLIADKTIIPERSRFYYSEKIVYLPNSYQVNDGKREISDKRFTRFELGLPESEFVFCCFCNNYKITPHTFAAWIRILNAVRGSVLWLFEDNPVAVKNLRREAEKRGLDSRRLIFAGRMTLPEHLARHRVADLFLDTMPCNAHTTASDALWAGLPLLTLAGETFASRVAASLLRAIDLPEMIASSQEDYEALAIDLATHPEKLHAVRRKLSRNRVTAPLFDTGLYATHLEDAYVQMHERYLAHLTPDHIYVS